MPDESNVESDHLDRIERLAELLWKTLIAVAIIAVVIFILAVALQFQISSRNDDLDRFGKQLDQYQTVINRVEASAQAAVATANEASDIAHQTHEAIDRIEKKLCEGPCPS